MNKQECLDRLDYISKLEYDWDSYEGDPIPDELINKTKKLLEYIDYNYVYFIAPFSVGVEIELNNGKEYPCLIITITNCESGILVCPEKYNTTWEYTNNISIVLIKNLISKLFI